MVDTDGFLLLYSKSCAYLQLTNFGHSHQTYVSSIMSPVHSEHGHSIFTQSSTFSSYLDPSCIAFSLPTNTFVQIDFSNPAVPCVMVCSQQPPGLVWMSTKLQDLSKHFHSFIKYLQHLLTSGSTINS
jgi:hypothetical protein